MKISSLRSLALVLTLALTGCAAGNKANQTVSDEMRARLARALLASGDPASAAEAMKTPEARASSEAPDQMVNAQILIAAGKVDEGMAIAKTALAARGDDPVFKLAVADLAVKANRLPDAEQVYRDVLRDHPANIEAMNGEAVVLAQQGNLGEAVTLLRTALAASPQNVPARTNLALALILSDQAEAATPLLEDLDRSNPSPQITAMLASARERRGVVMTADFHPPQKPATAPDGAPAILSAPVQTAVLTAPAPAETSPAMPSETVPAPQTAPVSGEPRSPHVHSHRIGDTIRLTVPLAPPKPSHGATADAWSCPNVCLLYHAVFDRKSGGQIDH